MPAGLPGSPFISFIPLIALVSIVARVPFISLAFFIALVCAVAVVPVHRLPLCLRDVVQRKCLQVTLHMYRTGHVSCTWQNIIPLHHTMTFFILQECKCGWLPREHALVGQGLAKCLRDATNASASCEFSRVNSAGVPSEGRGRNQSVEM